MAIVHAMLSSLAMEMWWTEGPKQATTKIELRDSSGISMVRIESFVGVQGSHSRTAVVPSALYAGAALRYVRLGPSGCSGSFRWRMK